MSDSDNNNNLPAKRPRINKSSGVEQKTTLAYEVVNGNVMEITDGEKRKLLDVPSGKGKGKGKKTSTSHWDSGEALRIMQSYGYSIKTPEERRIALNDFKRINKRAAKRDKHP